MAALGRRGTRPGRWEGPSNAARSPPPASPSPAAAVRGAERGPERRAPLPPSMRVLGVDLGWGGASEDDVRALVCSGSASC